MKSELCISFMHLRTTSRRLVGAARRSCGDRKACDATTCRRGQVRAVSAIESTILHNAIVILGRIW